MREGGRGPASSNPGIEAQLGKNAFTTATLQSVTKFPLSLLKPDHDHDPLRKVLLAVLDFNVIYFSQSAIKLKNYFISRIFRR